MNFKAKYFPNKGEEKIYAVISFRDDVKPKQFATLANKSLMFTTAKANKVEVKVTFNPAYTPEEIKAELEKIHEQVMNADPSDYQSEETNDE